MGSGCAFFDADGDGWPDILLINSKDWTPRGRKLPACALSQQPQRHVHRHHARAAVSTWRCTAWAWPSAITTTTAATTSTSRRSEGDRLFHNEGHGKFRDVTKAAGIKNANFGASAAWLDYDRDGKLDLFVANYVQWTPEGRPVVLARRRHQILLHAGVVQRHALAAVSTTSAAAGSKTWPRRPGSATPPASRWAWRCSTTTATAGRTSSSPTTRSPTSSTATTGNGTFTRRRHGGGRGVRRGRRGARRHGRGCRPITTAAAGRTCWSAISPTRCWACTTTKATGCSWTKRPSSTVGRASLLSLTFGAFFFDYDLDGYPDIFAANGHIDEEIGRVQPKVSYREPPLLFRNLGKRQFENVTAADGRCVQPPDRGARRGLRRFRPRRRPRHV